MGTNGPRVRMTWPEEGRTPLARRPLPMLEIFFLRWFYGFLANAAQEKGRSRSWGFLGVAFWFFGEVLGLFVGFASGGAELAAYAGALISAAIGAAIAFGIVKALPDETQTAPMQF